MSILFPDIARRTAATAAARRAVVSRRKDRYVMLACGHWSTEDVKEAYAFAAPKGAPYFCEACNGYFSKIRKSRHAVYPANPPY